MNTREEQIELVKRLLKTGVSDDARMVLERQFPEVLESEDERIGNLIYCIIRDREDIRNTLEANGVSVDNALSYLEKQKEQKLTDREMKEVLRWEYEKGKSDAIAEMKPAEWSEEDEKMLKLLILELEEEGKDVNVPELYRVEIDWLKSPRPQPHWKPSDEQMKALDKVINGEVLLTT